MKPRKMRVLCRIAAYIGPMPLCERMNASKRTERLSRVSEGAE